MARNSLHEFCEQLTLAYLSDVIDMEEYVYLYSTNQSREVFPYWKFNKFDSRIGMTQSVTKSCVSEKII